MRKTKNTSTTCKAKNCITRHPKLCSNIKKTEGFRFQEGCAYLYSNTNSTQQEDINEAVAVVVSKHNNTEIKILQDKVKLLIISLNIKLKTFEAAHNVSNNIEIAP